MTAPEGLGPWGDLPFFATDWPALADRLAADPGPVYPAAENRFRALALTPPEAVRVVLLGQDPYHTPGKADGLAFSIPEGFHGRLDSLGNILRELEDDLGIPRRRTDLSDWAAQGVLLLNTVLSVPQGQAQGHKALGWETFVAQVLSRLDDRPRALLLWGKPAQAIAARHLHNPDHLRLAAPHPSPLSAHRGFFGARHFSRVNAWLAARGERPVDWTGTSSD